MKNFNPFIMTYMGNGLRYNSSLSCDVRKVYLSDDDTITVCSSKGGHEYTIEIKTPDVTRYITVGNRRGVYSCLTYYELLVNEEQYNFIVNEYGSIRHYLEDVCFTMEYVRERYNF